MPEGQVTVAVGLDVSFGDFANDADAENVHHLEQALPCLVRLSPEKSTRVSGSADTPAAAKEAAIAAAS
jgi:hypothetical protein